MKSWLNSLRYDPITPLLDSENQALRFFVRRDLLAEDPGPVQQVWRLPDPQKILKKQLPDGSWRKPGPQKHPAINHNLIETWKRFRFLIDQYGFERSDPAVEKAAEFILSCQTDVGDIRGFLANQYATYYTGALLGLLIKAGYADDPRIERGFQWLLSMRQDDLGWTIPILTHKFDRETGYKLTSEMRPPVEPDRTRPFSHNWTGMILRAFAAHPRYRHSEAAKIGAAHLKSRFFERDVYTSYRSADYWIKFQFPFWWNNLVAALDSITLIDPTRDTPLQKALDWLIDHQEANGLWRLSYVAGVRTTPKKAEEMKLWVSLAICRILRRVDERLA